VTFRLALLPEQAIAEFRKARDLSPNDPAAGSVRAWLGYAYGKAGKKAEAQKLLDELQMQAKEHYVPAFDIAIIYLGLGEKDQTFAWLEKAYQERSPWLPWLNARTEFDRIRSDSRFTSLIQRVGLTP